MVPALLAEASPPVQGSPLGTADLAIIAIYLIGTVVWGAWPRKSSGTDEGFLLGGRSLAWPVLMMSIVATETSTVTFLSLPGTAFDDGGSLGFLQVTLGYMVGRLLVVGLMLPEYFRGRMFTAYEMLEQRFGSGVRGVASLTFLVCRTVADGLRLFLTALALQQALGWDFAACVVVITAATAVYATLGGVASVVKNDCLQLAVYTAGAVAAAAVIVRAVPGGWPAIAEFGAETGRLRVFDFRLGLTGGITFWSGLIGGSFLSLATHGVDHLMVQRYLCAGSQRKAALALGFSGPLVAMQFALFLLIGVGLAAFYDKVDVGYPIERGDAAFAAFLANETPAGLCGVLFAAVLAAAMSTLSSSLNASAGVLVKDLLEPLTGRGTVAMARAATVGFAVLQLGVALGANALLQRDSPVIGGVLAIAGFATGILVGLFALGVLRRRASQTAAFVALGSGAIVCTLVFMQGEIAWLWNALIASSSTLAAGLVVDFFVSPRDAPEPTA